MAEHLYMLLSFVLSLKAGAGDLKPLPALSSSQNTPVLTENLKSEVSRSLELLGRCEALERKTVTFENIVCVLNREVERVSLTAEAYNRQHQLDQKKIETLSNKVCKHWLGLPSTLSRSFFCFLPMLLAKLHQP